MSRDTRSCTIRFTGGPGGQTYQLEIDSVAVGFGTIAIGGPWTGKPTIFEFYVRPEFTWRAFDLFEAFLSASGARLFEVQTSDVMLAIMLHAYGTNVESERIVFCDQFTTDLSAQGTVLRVHSSDAEIRSCMEERQGGGRWVLELDDSTVATGGILFHYNIPYGDVYMDVQEPFRRRGLGSYLVQELKRECYRLGAIPAARTSTTNIASRRTLQRAGMVPFAHILTAELK